MRTIIAGGRDITSYGLVCLAVKESGFKITTVICGGARGVDLCGKMWACENKVPVEMFEPDWIRYGKAAGPMRNIEMAKNADALILVWDGQSRGSRNMLKEAKARNLLIHEHLVPCKTELVMIDHKSKTHDSWGYEMPPEARQDYLL